MRTTPLLLLCLAACRTAGPDPCDAAWAELEALRHAMEEVGPVEGPSQAEFAAACHALPPEARPCASITHQLDHWESCRDALDAMPQSMRDQVVRSLDGGGGPH